MSRAARFRAGAFAGVNSFADEPRAASDGDGPEPAYYLRSQRPWPSLLLLLPLIVLYEVGTLYFAIDSRRHTETRLLAFNFLQSLFDLFHVHRRYMPALAVVCILLTWHIARKDRWRISWRTPALMALEAVVLTLPLLALNCLTVKYVPLHAAAAGSARSASIVWEAGAGPSPKARDGGPAARLAFPDRPPAPRGYGLGSLPSIDLVLSVGAGIYEELMFRLVSFTLLTLLLEDALRINKHWAAVVMVVVSAFLFAGYHYLGHGEPFIARTFVFRSAAGIYFGYLFFARGFGITAGCHTAYDLIVFAIRSAVVGTA